MAFPVPSHLPRRAAPLDVSSQILNKIDATTTKELSAELAASWVTELDDTIHSTKERIHARIQEELPLFEQQLTSARSVRTRLQTLSTNVGIVETAISNPETGIIPRLIKSLTSHAAISQQSSDATILHTSLAHLLHSHAEFDRVSALVHGGHLPDAAEAFKKLDMVLSESPASLNQSNVMIDLKRKYIAMKSRAEEQLSNAFSQCVTVLPSQITISPSVQVSSTGADLSLAAIMAHMSPPALINHLNTIRRDLTLHFVDHILSHPLTTASTTTTFSIHTSASDEPFQRLENLSSALQFLSHRFFSVLPPEPSRVFRHSLCKPIASSLLSNLLVATLPSSFPLLPSFIELAQRAVVFEEKYVLDLLGGDRNDTPVREWVDHLCGHYERKRRLDILNTARLLVTAGDDTKNTFTAEMDAVMDERQPTVVPVQMDSSKEDAWGFSDEETDADSSQNGWSVHDANEIEGDDGVVPTDASSVEPTPTSKLENDPDPSDAWGWDDDDSAPAGNTEEPTEDPWDDPWDEPSTIKDSPEPPPPVPLPVPAQVTPSTLTPSISSPRIATRLEKLANKGKKSLSGSIVASSSSPAIASSSLVPRNNHFTSPPPTPNPNPLLPVPTPLVPQTTRPSNKKTTKPPPITPYAVPKESYLVSGQMREILKMVEDVLNESIEFASSPLIQSQSKSSSQSNPGKLLFAVAPSILDLYRALHPVVFKSQLSSSVQSPIRFSNNCLYLSQEVEKLGSGALKQDEVDASLTQCQHRLKILSRSWLDDTIEAQRQKANDLLTDGAAGFVSTTDQDRYDECEGAVSGVLQQVRRIAKQWKGLMTKSVYYTAIGSVADAILVRVLDDILALEDITEVESHRLSELCRILHALEGLFVEDPAQASFVVAYVPSWFKFSYLSELLEASMVDITYLFETRALVDFDVWELTRLVRALFADTPLRTTLLAKLSNGHPVSPES